MHADTLYGCHCAADEVAELSTGRRMTRGRMMSCDSWLSARNQPALLWEAGQTAREPGYLGRFDQVCSQPLLLKIRVNWSAMTEETKTFMRRKSGDGWTAAHLSLLEFQVKDLEAQMMNMQWYVDSLHAQLHALQLLVHRHSYLHEECQ